MNYNKFNCTIDTSESSSEDLATSLSELHDSYESEDLYAEAEDACYKVPKNKLHISIVKCDEDCECDFCTAFNKIICGGDEEEYGYDYEDQDEEEDGDEITFDKITSNKVVEKPCKVCKTNLFDYEEICWKCGALNPTD